jgi:hypothetical protein
MILTILDPRTGNRVAVSFANHPVVKQAVPTQVVSHPSSSAQSQS